MAKEYASKEELEESLSILDGGVDWNYAFVENGIFDLPMVSPVSFFWLQYNCRSSHGNLPHSDKSHAGKGAVKLWPHQDMESRSTLHTLHHGLTKIILLNPKLGVPDQLTRLRPKSSYSY